MEELHARYIYIYIGDRETLLGFSIDDLGKLDRRLIKVKMFRRVFEGERGTDTVGSSSTTDGRHEGRGGGGDVHGSGGRSIAAALNSAHGYCLPDHLGNCWPTALPANRT